MPFLAIIVCVKIHLIYIGYQVSSNVMPGNQVNIYSIYTTNMMKDWL